MLAENRRRGNMERKVMSKIDKSWSQSGQFHIGSWQRYGSHFLATWLLSLAPFHDAVFEKG